MDLDKPDRMTARGALAGRRVMLPLDADLRAPGRRLVLLQFGLQPNYESFAAPKLDCISADEMLCLLDCFDIVATNQGRLADDTAIMLQEVCPIVCHAVTCRAPASGAPNAGLFDRG